MTVTQGTTLSKVRGIVQEPAFLEVGRKFKSFREDAGYTQTEAALLFGVTKTTLSSWETGRKLPTSDNLKRMQRYYHIPYSYIEFINDLVVMSKNELIQKILQIMNEEK